MHKAARARKSEVKGLAGAQAQRLPLRASSPAILLQKDAPSDSIHQKLAWCLLDGNAPLGSGLRRAFQSPCCPARGRVLPPRHQALPWARLNPGFCAVQERFPKAAGPRAKQWQEIFLPLSLPPKQTSLPAAGDGHETAKPQQESSCPGQGEVTDSAGHTWITGSCHR